jgi:alkylated DNA repair dioxygenase AlkB
MRYHVDPDQGVYWTEHTCVVSVGDTREFVVRELGDYSRRHRFFVSGGDVVYMFADCQERYQHAVRVCEEAEDAGPRVSLVYKQSLEQGKRP